jgi:hypothetical protein
MVNIRGGLQNLGFDGAAQKTVSWYAQFEILLGTEAYHL